MNITVAIPLSPLHDPHTSTLFPPDCFSSSPYTYHVSAPKQYTTLRCAEVCKFKEVVVHGISKHRVISHRCSAEVAIQCMTVHPCWILIIAFSREDLILEVSDEVERVRGVRCVQCKMTTTIISVMIIRLINYSIITDVQ